MATFLATQGRYIVPMLPDGNCMFRSVVHQLVGDAKQHMQLRQATVAFTAQNGDTLKGYLTDSHGGHVSLQHHLNKMGNLGSWGTHVELKAMASMLQLPIYVLTDSLVPGECRWTRFLPCSGDILPLSVGTSDSWLASLGDRPRWIEICHSNESHYDSVKHIDSLSSSSPPHLSENNCLVVVE